MSSLTLDWLVQTIAAIILTACATAAFRWVKRIKIPATKIELAPNDLEQVVLKRPSLLFYAGEWIEMFSGSLLFTILVAAAAQWALSRMPGVQAILVGYVVNSIVVVLMASQVWFGTTRIIKRRHAVIELIKRHDNGE
jgi:hypothetical protein